MKGPVLAFSIIVSLAILFQLPNPSPTPPIHSKNQQYNAKPEYKRADKKEYESEPPKSEIQELRSEIEAINKRYEKNHNGDASSVERIATFLSGIATVLIAIFAAVQLCVLHRQRVTMDKQTALMRQSLVVGHAADVVLTSAFIESGPELLSSTKVHVCIKNFGNTRASDIWIKAAGEAIDMHRSGPINREMHPLIVHWGLQLPPGGEGFFIFAPLEGMLHTTIGDFAAIQRLRSGVQQLYLQIIIEFDDVFAERHRTIWGGIFRPDQDPQSVLMRVVKPTSTHE